MVANVPCPITFFPSSTFIYQIKKKNQLKKKERKKSTSIDE